jgi:hypothetical protein
VVAPGAVDEQVVLRESLVHESQALEQAAAARVVRHVVGLDPVELQDREHVLDRRFERLAHQSPALVGVIDRVAQHAGLERSAGDLRVVDATDHVLRHGAQAQHPPQHRSVLVVLDRALALGRPELRLRDTGRTRRVPRRQVLLVAPEEVRQRLRMAGRHVLDNQSRSDECRQHAITSQWANDSTFAPISGLMRSKQEIRDGDRT